MKGDLNTIIRVSKWKLDEKKRHMAALISEENLIEIAIRNLEKEMEKEQKVSAKGGLEVSFCIGSYIDYFLKRKKQYENSLWRTRLKIERLQDEIADAYTELKTYELAQENRDKEQEAELNRKEQADLDEMGLNMYRRQREAIEGENVEGDIGQQINN